MLRARTTTPAAPGAGAATADRLATVDALRASGAIDAREHEQQRARILASV